jgi:hypothetical protein
MQRALVQLLLLLSLAPAAAEPDSVTLEVEPQVATFGESVDLIGVVTPAAERVTVVALPYDGGAFPTVAVPDRAGHWRLSLRPRVTTQFRAQSGRVHSAEVPVVSVRPRVHLVVISARRGLFYVRTQAFFSYEGRTAFLQRLTRRGWRSVRRVRFGPRSTVRFRAQLPAGRSRIRVVVAPTAGYVSGFSRIAVVRR